MPIVVLLAAYLLGSIPTAVIVVRRLGGVDIRILGDGNMGAHNTKAQFGWSTGILVALIDFAKGALAVWIARVSGLDLGWQLLALAFAVVGHDFPVFAHFRGGQGLATTLGGLLVLANFEMALGLIIYGLIYLITHNSDLGAGIGTGTGVLLMTLRGQPLLLVVGSMMVILIIPAKFLLDRPRREHNITTSYSAHKDR
ncbi:MAG TPA: glycerol-3-phosphate acyltransferase [Bellilinea sp.]|nr:glycerol-3-phosphate acyltransferase [Bellilinea sp.]